MAREQAIILIVDDEEYNVDYLQQNLSDLGYATREAYGGREALESVSEQAPDLILLDVMMPDIDGITVCQILKDDPKTALIPIVIMTALDGHEDRIRGIEAGADDFLTKPVDERELVARINTLIRSKRAVDRTVDELRSATEQLEEVGSREENVAVLAVELRAESEDAADSPNDAHQYLRTRYASAVEQEIERRRGRLHTSSAERIVGVFRTSADRIADAIDAALAIAAETQSLNRDNRIQRFTPAFGISSGMLSVDPRRIDEEGSRLWVAHLTGRPLDQAVALASDSDAGTIAVSKTTFEEAGGRYSAHEPDPAAGLDQAVVVVGRTAPDRRTPTTQPATRQLETIFVSDVVGSTERATQLGDLAWGEMLEAHYKLVRGVFAEHDGREISTAGDGFLALFRAPANAVRAGLDLVRRSIAAELPVRVGIHTGEVERTKNDVQGIAVHLASRVSSAAEASQVLVTSTTKESVAGSGLDFESKGSLRLKGIDGDREVFVAVPGAP